MPGQATDTVGDRLCDRIRSPRQCLWHLGVRRIRCGVLPGFAAEHDQRVCTVGGVHATIPPAERTSSAERHKCSSLDRRRFGGPVFVAVSEPNVAVAARAAGITRSAMGMRLLKDHLAGALVTIGHAPTALLELLDLIDPGSPAPSAIVGMPVGLVAAAESKDELVRRTTPYVTVLGTRGGSPLAAAAVNALLQLAVEDVDG